MKEITSEELKKGLDILHECAAEGFEPAVEYLDEMKQKAKERKQQLLDSI